MNQLAQIVTEPFIGQIDYLTHLTDPGVDKKTSYMVIEMEVADIDLRSLEKALSFFVERHESIRTIFPSIGGEIKQVIMPYSKERFGINYIETDPEKGDFSAIRNMAHQEACAILTDLDCGPLVKFFVFKVKDNVSLVSVVIHHIICDAWSLKIIRKELAGLYATYANGKVPQLPPLPVQLRDYCSDKNIFFHKNSSRLSAFWKNKLSGFNEMIDTGLFYKNYSIRHELHAGGERPSGSNDQNELIRILNQQEGGVFSTRIGNDNLMKIRDLARENSASVSAVLYASFYIFLFVYTGKKKILLASLVADRFLPEYRNLIGCLLGGIYLPKEISGEYRVDKLIQETFHDLEECVRNLICDHDLLEIDGRSARISCDAYFNYVFSNEYLNTAGSHDEKAHKNCYDIFYAISCKISEYANALSIEWQYNKALFTEELIEDMVKCHEDVVSCMVRKEGVAVCDIANAVSGFFNMSI